MAYPEEVDIAWIPGGRIPVAQPPWDAALQLVYDLCSTAQKTRVLVLINLPNQSIVFSSAYQLLFQMVETK